MLPLLCNICLSGCKGHNYQYDNDSCNGDNDNASNAITMQIPISTVIAATSIRFPSLVVMAIVAFMVRLAVIAIIDVMNIIAVITALAIMVITV